MVYSFMMRATTWIRNTKTCIIIQFQHGDFVICAESYLELHKLNHLILQIISNKEMLLKHCHKYRNPAFPGTNNFCLQLNNLSLSRIGSMEQLLWVQVLDLRYNQLKTLEGNFSSSF